MEEKEMINKVRPRVDILDAIFKESCIDEEHFLINMDALSNTMAKCIFHNLDECYWNNVADLAAQAIKDLLKANKK